MSHIIKFFTKETYNHVSLGFDKSLEKELYSFGRYYARNPFWGGFIEENIREGLYKLKPRTKACVYEIDVNEEAYKKLKNFIAQVEKEKHKYRFNILGMFSVALNMPLRRRYKRYCAEFVSEILDTAGVYKSRRPYSLVKPNDFHDIKGASKIFEGLLKDYII
jgi:hypothetical protein